MALGERSEERFSLACVYPSSLASRAFARLENGKNNACYAGYRSKRDWTDILLPFNRTKDKMHAETNSRYSHCFCMLKAQFMIHLENRAGNTLLTDPHEIMYPV